ncbi:MAG: transglutaminase-like domain-containing protein, partial [Candidatus Zixiibacteriota bacterium]
DNPPGILDTTKDVAISQSSQVSLHTFAKRNLPALETEPFMPPSFNYLPSLAYSVSTYEDKEELKASWRNISKWYFETIEKKFKPGGDIKKTAKNLTKECRDDKEKIEKIFYFVEENFKINFPSRFVFDEAKRIFDQRNGTSAEVSGVLYAMLKAVGIKTTPVLVPDREKVSEIPNVPMLDWFDHLMLKVDLDSQAIWLDPSYETNPIGHIAEKYQGVDGLLIQKSGGKLMKMPSIGYMENWRTRLTDVKLSEDGKINCTVFEIYSLPRGAHLKNYLKRKNIVERKDELAKEISKHCPGALLDTSWFADLYDFDSDFEIFYKFHSPYYVNQANEVLYVNPNILHRDETAKEFSQPTRIFPIMFDQVKMDIDSVNIIIPSAYEVISLPEAVNLENDFGEFSTQYQVKDSLIIYRRKLAIKKLLIPSSSYKEVKNFFNQIFEQDQKTIILKKKE